MVPGVMYDPRTHWDKVYGSRSETEVSWYQRRPEQSLTLIRNAAPDLSTPVIDVGSGTTGLIAELAAIGYRDLTALDVSAAAIDKARRRLAEAADRVAWIVADITAWSPHRQWDVWHDRGVFHFLTGTAAQDAYIRALGAALAGGGTAIVATFALNGPETCSGLPVQRYSGATLAARLGAGFRLVSGTPERHVTPRGAVQNFMYAVFRRL
jgi:SAM-dependent methyltransferase